MDGVKMKFLASLVRIPFFLMLYHFLLFPLVLVAWGKLLRRNNVEELEYDPEPYEPTVTFLIAAKDEETWIERKIQNTLEQNYPRDKMRIIVAANGCTDKTVEIAKKYESQGVEVLEFGPIGKGQTQNLVIRDLDSEIVVLSDANVMYHPQSVYHLIQPFKDPTIGTTAGNHVYTNTDTPTGLTEGTYWRVVENKLKEAESLTGGLVGANGSIYAVRRELYVPVIPGLAEDIFGTVLIAVNGYRTVFVKDAIAWEKAEDKFSDEFNRKCRIVQHTAHGLFAKYPWLLDPRRSGRIAFLFWSHKVLRWFAPILLLIMVSSAVVRMVFKRADWMDNIVVSGGSLFGFLVLLGRGLGTQKPIPGLTHAYYIYLMFKAAVLGLWGAFTKGGIHTWTNPR